MLHLITVCMSSCAFKWSIFTFDYFFPTLVQRVSIVSQKPINMILSDQVFKAFYNFCFKEPLEHPKRRSLTGFICTERFASFSENPDKFRDVLSSQGDVLSHLAGHHGCSGPLLHLRCEWAYTEKGQGTHRWPTDHLSTSNSSCRWGCDPRTWPTLKLWRLCSPGLDEILYYLPIRRNEKVYGKACKLW